MKKQAKTPREIILAKRKSLSDRRAITGFFKKLFVIGVLLYLAFSLIFGMHMVKGEDMYPKLVASDLVFYYRLDKNFLKDDLVVADTKNGKIALRIVAMPGDTVDIRKDGLYINGSFQIENAIYYETGLVEGGKESYPIKLGEDQYFLLGDMRIGARDSRVHGPFNKSDLKGKVFALYRRTNF